MTESFELPVRYGDNELLFPAHLHQFGHAYRIVVNVYGTEISFEPDEERNFIAIATTDYLNKQVTLELLRAIAQAIEGILK